MRANMLTLVDFADATLPGGQHRDRAAASRRQQQKSGANGLQWVDGGPSFIVRESAAMGGFRSFVATAGNGEVAPIPTFPALLRNGEVRPTHSGPLNETGRRAAMCQK